MKSKQAMELEAWFLNHDDPIFEEVRAAATDEWGERVAADALAAAGVVYDEAALREVVRRIRAD